MSGENKEDGFAPQIVPINPEIYASYLCTSCFVNLPIEKVIKLFRTYLLTEKGLLEEQRKAWGKGILFHDPFRYLDHSIGFLRGTRTDPPFESGIFSLHNKEFPESSRIRFRRHLALVSFD